MSYQPPYTITPKITHLVAQISEAIGGYYAQENLRLHRVNRIQTIRGTLAIEGNTLTTEQVTAVLEGKPVVAPINEVQEVRNALKAYELLDVLDPHKVDDLLKTHATMEAGLIDDAGRFRRGGAGVAAGNQIIHYAPDAERVPYLVDDLFEWLRTTEEHPLIASCVFHYEFEFIHPFADGNGRTGRLWQTLILSRWRPIFKNLPLICEFADRETTLFIPVGFVAKSAENEPFESTLQTETGKQIEYLEYSPRDAEQYRNAGAWIFAGKNCSECNYLKANFFPQVFPKGTRIVLVDIDNRENLDLLLKLEKKLSIASPGNAPVLFYKNKLTYGADAIKQLFASRIQ